MMPVGEVAGASGGNAAEEETGVGCKCDMSDAVIELDGAPLFKEVTKFWKFRRLKIVNKNNNLVLFN